VTPCSLVNKYQASWRHTPEDIVIWHPKAAIMEPEWKYIASQWLARHTFQLQRIDTE
jgi:hypothetical protein